jgi:hypothetical protein
MYAYPLYPERKTESLDGIWDFAYLGDDAPKLEAVSLAGIVYGEVAAAAGQLRLPLRNTRAQRGVAAYRRCVAATAGTALRCCGSAHWGCAAASSGTGAKSASTSCPYSLQEYEFDSGEGGATSWSC